MWPMHGPIVSVCIRHWYILQVGYTAAFSMYVFLRGFLSLFHLMSLLSVLALANKALRRRWWVLFEYYYHILKICNVGSYTFGLLSYTQIDGSFLRTRKDLSCLLFIVPLEDFQSFRDASCSIQGHSAVRVRWHATTIMTRDICLKGHLREPVTFPISLLLQRCFHDLGLSRLRFKHLTFRMRVKRSNKLRRRMIWPKWQHPIGNLIKSLLPRLG